MSTHKQIDKICCGVMLFTLIVTAVFMNGERLGIMPVMAQTGYASRLFDDSRVHSIDIVMEDWDSFLDTCENEEYSACSVVIDNEAYKNVGIRAKGNTSLSQVKEYGNDRYSFKIEFDCYEKGNSYHGLDKISLNNIIQDNTYMKDYLTYKMMGDFGVAAPLCSYVYITVNGEEWGLYLAVESVEESFLARNYGNGYGNLYKPDSMDMGGGRGNGDKFDREGMEEFFGGARGEDRKDAGELPKKAQKGFDGEIPELPGGVGGFEKSEMPGGGPPQFGGMFKGSSDVLLQYTDDASDSYINIFDNAKTDITDTDKKRLIASLKKMGQGEDIEHVVDVEAVIRYFVVHNFVCNFDSYTGSMVHNYYLYEKDGQLSMIPWDYNLAFGGFEAQSDADGNGGSNANSMVNFPIDSPVSGGSVEERPMLAWIFNNEEYTEMYHRYFQEFLDSHFADGSFSNSYFEEMISSVKEMIAPYVEKDPTKFCSYEEFEKGSDTLKQFCLLRAESIRGQLAGTIPSTSEGQQQDKTALVDASGISISDMGTMAGRGGFPSHR
ncbi:MAG: spore coat protein CotH [Lachnospiraceae bacterium]|jgi:spore coat protein CotH|nr:spore coat protein CotH [Lachnospiraceae bacterium]MCI9324857.1 spore coat protein CotH [Lachnospiraceae bacterium]